MTGILSLYAKKFYKRQMINKGGILSCQARVLFCKRRGMRVFGKLGDAINYSLVYWEHLTSYLRW